MAAGGKVSAKGAVITVDDSAGSPQIISSDCIAYKIPNQVDALDVTGFGDGSKNYTPGLLEFTIEIDVIWNQAATTGAYTVLKGILGAAASKTVSILPEAAGKTFSGEFMLVSFEPQATIKDAIKMGTAKFVVMGSVAPAWA